LDDEEFIRMIIPRWLKPLGCEVISCENGRQAVELYKQALEAGKPFDLLILDLTIPGGIGGQAVLREILALHPAARAIVSSGYAEGPIMANFSTYGFKGVLAKPYTEQQLQEVVTTVLE
jgi:CheY-like chemotaxis protein